MKVGDLVKIKWITFAQMRRAKYMGRPSDELGVVEGVHQNACKVIFPSLNDKPHTYVSGDLEVVSQGSQK